MDCEKFCQGGVNTKYGLVADGLDKEVQTMDLRKTHTIKKIIKTPDARFVCPIGCILNPKTKEGVINVLRNGATRGHICRANKWRFVKVPAIN